MSKSSRGVDGNGRRSNVSAQSRILHELLAGRDIFELVREYGPEAVGSVLKRLSLGLRLAAPIRHKSVRSVYRMVASLGLSALMSRDPLSLIQVGANLVILAWNVGVGVSGPEKEFAESVLRVLSPLLAARAFTGGYGESIASEGIVGRRYTIPADMFDALRRIGLREEIVERIIEVVEANHTNVLRDSGGEIVAYEVTESVVSMIAQYIVAHVLPRIVELASKILRESVERVEFIAPEVEVLRSVDRVLRDIESKFAAADAIAGEEE